MHTTVVIATVLVALVFLAAFAVWRKLKPNVPAPPSPFRKTRRSSRLPATADSADTETGNLDFWERASAGHILSRGEFVAEGVTHPYAVIHAHFFRTLPNFAGMESGVLYVSSDIPGSYRDLIFQIEIVARRYQEDWVYSHYKAFEEVIGLIPDENLQGFLHSREMYYRALAHFPNATPEQQQDAKGMLEFFTPTPTPAPQVLA